METPVDRIEDLFGPWKHTHWGFVIYRCTYSSDNDFAALISSIKATTSENLEIYGANKRPIAQHLSWKIVEDRVRLNNVSKADVRKLFDEWCQSTEAAAEQPESAHPVAQSPNTRYRFCVHIDQASLESFKTSRPWVNVIMRKWPNRPEQEDEDNDEDEDDDEDSASLEEVGGSTEEDVGWCKVKASSLLPDSFSRLCYPNAWYRFYQRPPVVV